jgi:hypothetical protein
MARTPGINLDNSFVGGRVSQATALNFPANACIDESNCVFDERGFARRRYGIDYETGATTKVIDRSSSAVSIFLWRNATGDGTSDIAVVQVGNTLYFYLANNVIGLSSGALATTVTLSTFTPTEGAGGTILANECQFSSGLSYLFVFHPYLDPFYVTYDKVAQTVTANRITVQQRDFDGVNDALAIDNRPGTLTAVHNYNLLNQGWDATKITSWFTSQANYPANTDVWWLYRNAITDSFDPTVSGDFNKGNTPAPKGHYVLNSFNQDRSAVSGLAIGAAVTTSGVRPSVGAFFAGRVFYAGINSSTYTTKILFSQTIETTNDFGLCYQEQDPSSEQLFDLLPTDGGVINIPEAGIIYKLAPFGDSLLVFGYNGVWSISGSKGIGFSADDYTVTLVGNIRCVSSSNFVVVDGVPVWMNLNGVYSISNDANGNMLINSLSDKSIKEYFKTIPFLSKRQARGAYNPITHTIQWLYRSTVATDPGNIYEFDRVLNYNVLTGAFYTWTISSPSVSPAVRVNGIICLDTGGSTNLSASTVVDNGVNTVTDSLGNIVVTYGLGTISSTASTTIVTKFLTSSANAGSYKFTWSESATNNGYKDWIAAGNPTNYTSYFVTGYKIPTQGAKKFQTNFLYAFSDAPDATKFTVQTQWDFANLSEANRWSNRQLVNITPTGYDFKRSRLLLRGSGHALAIKFSSVDDTGFSLAGWAMESTGEMQYPARQINQI